MNTLETQARLRWRVWADYRQYGLCQSCGRITYVGRSRRSRWLCLECWDQNDRGRL